MNKTLIINAHPKIDDTSSVSLQVFNHFLKAYKGLIHDSEVIE